MLRPLSRILSVLSFWFLSGGVAWGQAPYLVKDLHPGEDPAVGAGGTSLTATADLLFFWGDFPAAGEEIWRSDGTAAGTFLLLDILPGLGTSDPNGSDPNEMAALGDLLLFAADDGALGDELWRTDGTPEGTVLVEEIRPGVFGADISNLTAVGGLAYFQSWGADNILGLWRSDGTAAGTFEIDLGPDIVDTAQLTAVGDSVFFFAYDTGLGHYSLWKTDGLTATEVSPGTEGWIYMNEMAAVEDGVFFVAWDGAGTETGLWKSDGTAAGTVLVRNFGLDSVPEELTAFGGHLYFRGFDAAAGLELWRSDGTAAGTVRVVDLNPGPAGSFPFELTAFAGSLLFRANDGVSGDELWRTDGTAAGTVLLRDFVPGAEGSFPHQLIPVADRLFFSVVQPGTGELWNTDGTPAGTRRVKSFGELSSSPYELTAAGSTLFFMSYSGLAPELWRSDGTEAGTHPVVESGGPATSVIDGLLDVDGTLYFRGGDQFLNECLLWRSDGTEAGTVPLGGPDSPCPFDLTEAGGTVFFRGTTADLWKVEGTGVVKVGDLGSGFFGIRSLEGAGGRLFFNGHDDAAGSELWMSDGTGITRVADIIPGPVGSNPDELTASNGVLYFRAFDGAFGFDLWRSDGTAAGTFLLKDSGFVNQARVEELTDAGPLLFFTVRSGFQRELWRTDGTPAGTFALLSAGTGSLTAVGGRLFFLSGDEQGTWLWKSDGTVAGTVRVKLLPPSAFADALTAVGSRLFFGVEEPVTGRELWVSDGTAAGTRLVADLAPGPLSSLHWPIEIGDAFGLAVFAAADPLHGQEVWLSDGTAAGTFRLQDIAAGRFPSTPLHFTASGRRVFFSADDGVHGRELWAFSPPQTISGTVTGGGWIAVPAPSGKGHFQVQGKIDKGSATEGSVRFRFPGVDFRSTALRGLEISGSLARLQGDGTVNGRTRYRFLVALVDGQAPGGGGTDRFRIRIWSGPTVVYDSEPGAPDDAVPTRPIGGGSIVIRKPKK